MDVSKRNDGLQFNMGNPAILRIPILGDTVSSGRSHLAKRHPASTRSQTARPLPPRRRAPSDEVTPPLLATGGDRRASLALGVFSNVRHPNLGNLGSYTDGGGSVEIVPSHGE